MTDIRKAISKRLAEEKREKENNPFFVKQETAIMRGKLYQGEKELEGDYEVAVNFFPEDKRRGQRLGYVIGLATRLK